ncbi:MAG: hypothetical protein ACRYG4_20315 [Janthinobacterium lividum]
MNFALPSRLASALADLRGHVLGQADRQQVADAVCTIVAGRGHKRLRTVEAAGRDFRRRRSDGRKAGLDPADVAERRVGAGRQRKEQRGDRVPRDVGCPAIAVAQAYIDESGKPRDRATRRNPRQQRASGATDPKGSD